MSENVLLFEEVQDFVENGWSKINAETLENEINGISNRI